MQFPELVLHLFRCFDRQEERSRITGQAGEEEDHDQQPDQGDQTGHGAFSDEAQHGVLEENDAAGSSRRMTCLGTGGDCRPTIT